MDAIGNADRCTGKAIPLRNGAQPGRTPSSHEGQTWRSRLREDLLICESQGTVRKAARSWVSLGCALSAAGGDLHPLAGREFAALAMRSFGWIT